MSIKCFILFFTLGIPTRLEADDSARHRIDGVDIICFGENKPVNEMAIYPRGGVPGQPLLIAAHGGGGCGPKEIEGWIDLAKRDNFTVVCPTFLSGMTSSMYIPLDGPYFKSCLHWIKDHLQYDRKNAFMTGFSGGGYPVWYLATAYPDFFRGLFLQSGNFAGGQYYGFSLAGWTDKPIRLVWGTEDMPTVITQNEQAVELLRSMNFKNFSSIVISGAHHEPHHELVVSWMKKQKDLKSSN